MRYYSEETIKDFLHYALPPFSEVSSSDIEDYPYIEIGDTQSNWHTGTPTEEGNYRVALEYGGDVTFDMLYWLYDWSYFDEKYKILAWQKIKPYRG